MAKAPQWTDEIHPISRGSRKRMKFSGIAQSQ